MNEGLPRGCKAAGERRIDRAHDGFPERRIRGADELAHLREPHGGRLRRTGKRQVVVGEPVQCALARAGCLGQRVGRARMLDFLERVGLEAGQRGDPLLVFFGGLAMHRRGLSELPAVALHAQHELMLNGPAQ